MRITEVRDESVSIRSEIRNAIIDFSEMTASAVAIHTDVVRNGKPVVGYGFHSNGRYSQSGIIRDRLAPRLLRAPAEALLADDQSNFDPTKSWRLMMAN
jgi:hypothetical protein